jgi:hypothetical protein
MDIVGWYFGAAVTLIPTWLVLRAWHRYSKLDKRALRDLPQMRTGITFLSFSAGMWLALFVLIFAVDRGRPAGWIEQNVSPITLALINVPICAGGIACSRLGRKSAGESLSLRKAIGLTSGCLMLIWLLVLSNPH